MSRRLTIAGLSAIALAAALAAWAGLNAPVHAMQSSACGPDQVVPLLNATPYQWKAGKQVSVWVDRDGSGAGAGQENPHPKFTLDSRDASAVFAGLNQWGDIEETGVTFSLARTNAGNQANYWFTVAWPKAALTFRSSDGQSRQATCTVPPTSRRAAAYTCSFEDVIRGISQSHTVIAAVTMLNTHHSYLNPADGESYQTWVRLAPGWLPALTKIAAHENAHPMGLADMPALYPDGLEVPHVMKPLNGSNDNAPHGGAPRLTAVTECDREVVLHHQSRQYFRRVCAGPGAVSPPHCPQGETPVCDAEHSEYPAPTWVCPSFSSHLVQSPVFVPTLAAPGADRR